MLKASLPVIFFVNSCLLSNAYAEIDQSSAKALADDYAIVISTATGIVGELQQDINSSTIKPEQIAIPTIFKNFKKKYKAKTGKNYNASAPNILGTMRGHVLMSLEGIINEYKNEILDGGQDAFVPAYFRALMVEQVNSNMDGIMQSHVTNREADLINTDSAVEIVTENSPIANEFIKLVNSGTTKVIGKVINNHYMSYNPFTLKTSCVACHTRNGINHQKPGGFGGALIIDIPLQ